MSRIQRQPDSLASRLRLMKLEPRMLFDGAAVAVAVDAAHSVDSADSADKTAQTAPPAPVETPVETAPSASEQSAAPVSADAADTAIAYFDVSQLPPEFQDAAALASQNILDFAKTATNEQWYALFNGGEASDAAWTARLDALRSSLLDGGLVITVAAIDASAMPDAVAAFTANGPDGGMTIFINTAWTNLLGTQDIARALTEEFGHALDYQLNGDHDTPGDEGEAFAAQVLDWAETSSALQRIATENDQRTIEWNGQSYAIETAVYTFVNSYEVLISDTVFAVKELNSASFDGGDPLGVATIDDSNFNSKYFSGNDVSAIGLNIGGTMYYGWISRPIKSGGITRGFYFWTDTDFTNLAIAQADGNTDGDSNATDNQAFILVVDQAWFDQQIASGNNGIVAVGTSSNRVDAAINAEIDKQAANPPPPLVTTGADTADGANGSVAAVEGVDGNVGVNASGNVLTNDATANPGAMLAVTQISANGSDSAVSSGTPGVIAGKYGTLTIDASGHYTYAVNNTNPTVDALNAGGALNDVFTYTVTDSKGVTASTTLTIVIKGANDSPTANPDYNSAKIHLSSNDPGYNASGNVLINDADVDNTLTDKYVDLGSLVVTGVVDAGTVVVQPGTITMAFTTNPNGSGIGDFVVYTDGTNYHKLYDANGVLVTLTNAPTGSIAATVSGIPSYYKDNSGNPVYISLSANAFSVIAKSSNKFTITGQGPTGDVAASNTGGTPTTISAPSTTGSTTLSGLSGLSGTITEGMAVAGPNVPGGTTIKTINRDGNGAITSIVLSQPLTSNITSGHFTFTAVPNASNELQGAHGKLQLNSDGSYTYTANTNDSTLSVGQSAVEAFNYTMYDKVNGTTSSSTLYVTVYGSGSNDPILKDDAGTAKETGVVQGSNATGNVLTNDTNLGTNPSVVSYTLDGSTAPATTAGITAKLDGKYGTLTIDTQGNYTYTVDNANATVNSLPVGSSLTESFTYKVTNTAGGTSFAHLTITINGENDAPVAVADTAAVAKAGAHSASGSVLVNDSDVDKGDTLTVVNVGAGTATDKAAGASVNGKYGTLTINADGSYKYVLDTSRAMTQQLGAGQTDNEKFTYMVSDGKGGTTTATLTIAITGANSPPTNLFNGQSFSDTETTTVTTTEGTPIQFTGDKTISVVDENDNLKTIVLAVDSGILSVDTSNLNGVTVVGNNSSNLTITIDGGSQDDLNAVLATLTYTPTSGFYGSDFLTIASRDGDSADDPLSRTWDSDGIAIVIPMITETTVNESVLSAGSGGDVATGKVTIPAGQALPTGNPQTGDLRDALNAIVGEWSVDSEGNFTVTLTKASSTNTAQFTYTTIDTFGNAIDNIIKVEITDDAPIAQADTNTVAVNTSVAGNVLTDGTADIFGADGAKSTGGVVGVRAAGADTSSEVTSGVGNVINGIYGTLTLAASGAYNYVANASVAAASQTDTFVYTIEDADGSRSTTTLTVTVTDNSQLVDKLPTVEAGQAAQSDVGLSSQAASTGSLKFDFGGDGPNAVTPVSFSYDGGLGAATQTTDGNGNTVFTADNWTLTIDTTTGAYSFQQTGAYQHGAGASNASGQVTVTLTDGNGSQASSVLTLTITDDVPTISVGSTLNVASGGVSGPGNLSFDFGADAGTGATLTVNGNAFTLPTSGTTDITGNHGVLKVDATGSYSYTAHANTSGQTDTFTFVITDADGDTQTATLTVTITAAGGPGAISNLEVNEHGLGDAADTGETAEITLPSGFTYEGVKTNGTYGTVLEIGGKLVYTLTSAYTHPSGNGANKAVDGDTVVLTVKDSGGNSFDLTVKVNITDDVPTISVGSALNVASGGVSGPGNLSFDFGADAGTDATLTVNGADFTLPASGTTDITGNHGVLKVDATGNYSYTAHANTSGQTDTFTFVITDADGDTQTATLTVNMNQLATFGGKSTGSVTEDSGDYTATGKVDVTDSDSSTDITPQTNEAGTYGSFSIDKDGKWTYTADNALLQPLSVTAETTEIFTIQSADGTRHDIVITLNGVNDAPAFDGDLTGSVTEDSGVYTATGKVDVTDSDSSTDITPQTNVVGTYGSFSIDKDGKWTYTADNAKLQSLSVTAETTETFTIQSADGTMHDIVITLNGVKEVVEDDKATPPVPPPPSLPVAAPVFTTPATTVTDIAAVNSGAGSVESASSQPGTIGAISPSLHVLVAVSEVQELSSGAAPAADGAGFSSVGAGLAIDPSLHVLPAVHEVALNGSQSFRHVFDANESFLRSADDDFDSDRPASPRAADFPDQADAAANNAPAAAPATAEAAGNAAQKAAVSGDLPPSDELEDLKDVADQALSPAPARSASAVEIVRRSDIVVQLQRLSHHRSAAAQARALAQQLAAFGPGPLPGERHGARG
ncbi:MAG: VCBS domain-containing protein [Azonexus sp.]|nr:VCBS domain-containing protein [Azonexus sp.]